MLSLQSLYNDPPLFVKTKFTSFNVPSYINIVHTLNVSSTVCNIAHQAY